MKHNQENATKTTEAPKEERRQSFTERIVSWFPDLRTKRQQAVDKKVVDEDLAEERRSVEEDEQFKKQVKEATPAQQQK